MRTLEKMSTRLPLQSPLFLLGLFLRRLVEGRSKCCSLACLFCLIRPLAIAAAMAPNVQSAPRSTDHTHSRLSELAARVTVPWFHCDVKWQIRIFLLKYAVLGGARSYPNTT